MEADPTPLLPRERDPSKQKGTFWPFQGFPPPPQGVSLVGGPWKGPLCGGQGARWVTGQFWGAAAPGRSRGSQRRVPDRGDLRCVVAPGSSHTPLVFAESSPRSGALRRALTSGTVA